MPINGNSKKRAIAEAAIAALLRFGVAAGFIFYVSNWGGKWWQGAQEMFLAAIAAMILAGAVAGGSVVEVVRHRRLVGQVAKQ